MQALEDEEFRAFVQARGHALLRTDYLLTGDRQLAEDLVQGYVRAQACIAPFWPRLAGWSRGKACGHAANLR